MRAAYGDEEVVIHGEEVGRLKAYELKYLEQFDGVVVKLDISRKCPRLVISAV